LTTKVDRALKRLGEIEGRAIGESFNMACFHLGGNATSRHYQYAAQDIWVESRFLESDPTRNEELPEGTTRW
jgi:hypothetical protein